ncbi:MAG: HD domain-containing protein [Oscillospiraceae bacterium]|nr:HD domain-containing protein [Oscillospiraceae bacterium]
MLIILTEILALLIPLAGAAALLYHRQQSESGVRLMLTSVGCLIMNGGTLLMECAHSEEAADMAYRFAFFGSAMFCYFFICFLIAYLRLNIPRQLLLGWGAFECIVVAVQWIDRLREVFIGHHHFIRNETFGIYAVEITQSSLYVFRNILLMLIMLCGLFYTLFRRSVNKLPAERRNLGRLAAAQFIVTTAMLLQLAARPGIQLTPVFCSLSLLSVVISMLTDGFFGVTDSGHEWVFKQMENPYIITDNQYGYLDANSHAKALFPELKTLGQNERIPDRLYTLFTSSNTHFELGEEAFERKVTELKKKNETVGYGLLLEDDTEQQKYVRLLNSYNSRLQSDVEEKTDHIRKVQNSIITGMASVIESRDNSTGGHINRTSHVVRIFAKKLLQEKMVCEMLGLDQPFLHNVTKAAPMHDLGKIAVDDQILRKPGKFTEEETAAMQKHPTEGAKILRKMLHEVDDEKFVQIAVNIAHYHHEHFDGTGYPEHKKGEDIPVEARIMALADVFDALVSKRCYKEPLTPDDAFAIIEQSLGAQFDPMLGTVFLKCRAELTAFYQNLDCS